MEPETSPLLEKVLLLSGFHEALQAVVKSVLAYAADVPQTLSRNTRSVVEQGDVRVKWERRRRDLGFEIKYMDHSEFWIHPQVELPMMVALGTATPNGVRMNAAKGGQWLQVSGTASLFDEEGQESKFLVFMIDPQSTEANPGAWLVLARGVDEHDQRTVHHNGFKAILDVEPTVGGGVVIDF